MLSKKVEDILNVQIEKEAYSSNLYLAMGTWADDNGFAGVASWFYAQSNEERLHMLKFLKYVTERGGKAIIPQIEKPPVGYGTVRDAFKKVMEHEQFITKSINDIVSVCIDEKDYTTQSWVQWFVNEQIEEEASVQEIIDKLNLVGDHNMYMFDRDILSMRTAGSANAGA